MIKPIPLFVVFLYVFQVLSGQQGPSDDLGIQEVTVVRSYSPSLQNVFKIRTEPQIEDSLTQKQQKVNYTFDPVPVVSTFVPNKASPLKLQKQESSSPSNSYFSGGFGMPSQLQLDFSSTVPLDRNQSIGLKLFYHGVGAIENTRLSSDQKRTALHLLHQYKQNRMRVDSDLKFDRQHHNFFGLYDLNWEKIPSFRANLIDPSQNLNYLSIRTHWQWYDSPLTHAHLNTRITTDRFDSNEHWININAQLRLPILDHYMALIPELDLVNTNFVRGYYDPEALSYQKGLAGVTFKFFNRDKPLKYSLGARGYHPFGGPEAAAGFFVFPTLAISYRLPNAKIEPFLDYQGRYELNSYTAFSLQNPYLAPAIHMADTQYKHQGEIGFHAYPGSGLTFKLYAHYSQVDHFPLFKRLPYVHNNNDIPYRLGNAYEVIYDNMNKMGIVTALQIRFSEYNKISLETRYFEYQREGDLKAWNLPKLSLELRGNFSLAKRFFIQFNGQFMGKRESQKYNITPLQDQNDAFATLETLPSVFSVASEITWKISDHWDVFYENHLYLGDSTSRWAYYLNQQQLHLGGVRYKFNINL